MPAKYNIATDTRDIPYAIVLGGGDKGEALAGKLTELGSEVIHQDDYPKFGRFTYIFQFAIVHKVQTALNTHLKDGGKFLFIDTDNEDIDRLPTLPSLRILRVGDLDAWSKTELTEKILKTTFSISSGKVIDLRRKSPILKEPKPFITSYSASPPQSVSKAPSRFKQTRESDKHHPPAEATQIPVNVRHVSRSRFFIMVLILFLILGFSGGGIYWYIASLKTTFAHLRTDLMAGRYREADNDLKKARSQLRIANNIYDISYSVLIPFRSALVMQDTGALLSSVNSLMSTGDETLRFAESFMSVNKNVFSGAASMTSDDVAAWKTNIAVLLSSAQNARGRLESTSLPLPAKDETLAFLDKTIVTLSAAKRVLPVVDTLFLAPGSRTYLLLFQNNMELRPTGGFIGSYGLLTVADGKVVSLNVADVYTADGQLKGHVEPPSPIRKYLNQPHFFLRDSNFDPDFTKSAEQAAWFIEKEINVKVDGVIGVNLFFVQNLLTVTGPVTLPDFGNVEVSAETLFARAQTLISQDFFPGSTTKKDFLSALTHAIGGKLSANTDGVSYLSFFETISTSLEQKNILLYSRAGPVEDVITAEGWGGRMVDVRCIAGQGSTCYPDYLGVVEANLGVNKANYFVGKSVVVEKKLSDDGKLTSIVTISYENKSIPEVLQGGVYTNYLRLFIPADSSLLSVTLNTVPIAGSDVDFVTYGVDKLAVGFLVKIAPGNQGVVKITYANARNLAADVGSYQFFVQKQAGDKTAPLVLSVTTPKNQQFHPVNFPRSGNREQEIFYTTDTSVDRVFVLGR